MEFVLPPARAADVHAAFESPQSKGVIATIGAKLRIDPRARAITAGPGGQ